MCYGTCGQMPGWTCTDLPESLLVGFGLTSGIGVRVRMDM